MPSWLVNLIVKLILEQIANGGVEKLAEKFRSFVIPLIQDGKDQVFEGLKKAAAEKTPGFEVDDVLVAALDEFFDHVLKGGHRLLALTEKTPESVA